MYSESWAAAFFRVMGGRCFFESSAAAVRLQRHALSCVGPEEPEADEQHNDTEERHLKPPSCPYRRSLKQTSASVLLLSP